MCPGVDDWVPQDYKEMPILFVTNEGKPNSALVSWEYGNKPGVCHGLGLIAIADIPSGNEVLPQSVTACLFN
jgi:hypothetical protein